MAKLEKVDTLTDMLTGEVVRRTSNVITLRKLDEEPSFIKMYVHDLSMVMGLQNTHRDILLYVAASVGYDGVVSLTAGRKERIAMTVGVSEKTVRNALSEFAKAGIVRRIGRGEYELDPHLFAKGDWRNIRERRERFRAVIEYSEKDGRTVTTQRMSADEMARSEMEMELGQKRLIG